MIDFYGKPISPEELADMLQEYYESPVSLLVSGDHTVNDNQTEGS